MHQKRMFVLFAIAGLALGTLLGWMGAQARVSEATAPANEAAAAQVVSNTFSYQGVLEEDGEPVTGDREMAFTLYTDGACTTQVGSAQTEAVSVSDGHFDVELSFDAAHFDGKALWLETEVEGTAIGCQPFQATPYALSLRPGAVVSAATGSGEHLLHARSGTTGPDEGVLGAKVGYRSGLGYPVGVHGYAYEFGAVGLWGVSDGEFGWGVNGVADGPNSIGVRGVANAFTSTTYGVYGEANSPSGYAAYFDHTAASGDGVALAAVGPTGALITGTDGAGLSVYATGSTGDDDAVRGDHAEGDGVVGFSDGPGNLDNGVIGFTDGGYGIYGFSNAGGQYGGYFDDPIFVTGGCTGCTTSYVARNTSAGTLQPGAIVQTEGVAAEQPGAQLPVLQVAAAESGERVLGVVVGRTERTMVEPGADDAQPGPHYGPVGGAAEPGDYLVVVVQGMAQVRVGAAADIRPGDRIGLAADGTAQAVDASPIGMALDRPDENGLAWVLLGLE